MMEMVYHLKNWEFMRDMMCSNPGFVIRDMIIVLEDMRIPLPEKNREA